MKKYLILLLVCISVLFSEDAYADNARIVDNAGILNEEEINELSKELDELSNNYNYDIVVYFSSDTTYGDDVVSEGCEFFDLNGYGYGDDHAGLLLIVNYETSRFDIITTGDDVRNKYDGYLQYGCEVIAPYLRDNPKYAIELFEEWINTRFISNDYKEDINNPPISEEVSSTTKLENAIFMSLGVSIIVSVVTMIILSRQLKTEGKKHDAYGYVVPNSFNLTRAGDIFLYRSFKRRRIERDNHNNGNGMHMSHTSSVGISHGSSGGHSF